MKLPFSWMLPTLSLMTCLISLPALGAKSANGLAYWEAGSGPAVVFLHGSNLDHRVWKREAEALSSKYRVITYDLRGHGQSEHPSGPFLASDDLKSLLDELKVDKAMLVGNSAGGQIAIDFALQYPERVQALALAAPGVGGYRPPRMPDFFQDLVAALQARDLDKANEVLLASSVFAAPESDQALVRSMVEDNRDLWTINPAFVQMLEPAAMSRLEELTAPVLVMVGDQDEDYLKSLARTIAERAPNAQFELIPGGRHLLNLSSPDEFHRLLSEFLDKQAG